MFRPWICCIHSLAYGFISSSLYFWSRLRIYICLFPVCLYWQPFYLRYECVHNVLLIINGSIISRWHRVLVFRNKTWTVQGFRYPDFSIYYLNNICWILTMRCCLYNLVQLSLRAHSLLRHSLLCLLVKLSYNGQFVGTWKSRTWQAVD